MKLFPGILFITCALLLLSVQLSGIDAVVSGDGSGDFHTIQEAIDAAPDNLKSSYVILIKKGTYDEKLFIEKNFISLLGEDRDSTLIKTAVLRRIWREDHDSDWGAATVNIKSGVEDLTLANLTVLNNFAEENPEVSNPNDHTFAIRGGGHRIIIVNCNIIATGGDTLSLWNTSGGMYYHNDCYFEGYVDFVCPRGYCYIVDSEFYGFNNNASIWHDGSGGIGQKLVIESSEFDGLEDFALGRYHKDAAFYLLNCDFSEPMRNLTIRFVGSASDYQWGKRVYYFQCEKEGIPYGWYSDNLETASRNPHPGHIDAGWTFYHLWDPESSIDSLLPMASIPHPFNRERNVSKNIQLTWVPARNTTDHEIYLGSHPDSLLMIGSSQVAEYSPGNLLDTTSYYWRVNTRTSGGIIEGKIWSFTTHLESMPGIAFDEWPGNDSTVTKALILKWAYDHTTVDSFLVYFGESPDQLVFMGARTDASYPAETLPGRTYYWRIDNQNEYGVTSGEVWNFRHLDHTGTKSVITPKAPFRQVFSESSVGDWELAYYVDLPEDYKLILYDLQGRQLHTFDQGYCFVGYHYVRGDEILKDSGPLSNGVYICSLVSPTSRTNIKVYIQ